MNADRAQLKQLMYGMNNKPDVSTDKPQAKPKHPDTPARITNKYQTIFEKQKKLLNLERPDSMKFFIIS